jgi:uncharacterized protein (TIGR02284 family)
MSKNIIDHLNKLITRNYDAEKGYLNAAKLVDDASLKHLFKTYAEQRYKFGHDVKGEIKAMGGEVDKGSSILGDMHRTWMKLRDAVTKHSEEEILDECVRGEEVALADYREVLNEENLPETTKMIVDNHVAGVEECLYQIKELQKNYEQQH